MRREIEDLKEKIYMCGEEYKTIFIEKSRLEKKVQRMTSKSKLKNFIKIVWRILNSVVVA